MLRSDSLRRVRARPGLCLIAFGLGLAALPALPAYASTAPQVASIKTTVAKGTTVSLDGSFYQSITATSVGSTSKWYVTYKPTCDEGASGKYYTAGNTFTHKFLQQNGDTCWHNGYSLAPVNASGATGTLTYAAGTDNPGIVDDDVYQLSGSWVHGTYSQAYGGGYVRGSSIGAQASVTTDVLWNGQPNYSTGIVGATGPNGGIATIYVDGVKKGTVNFYSATVKSRKVLYVYGSATTETFSLPTHTIALTMTGKGTGGGTNMTLDAVIGDECCNTIGMP